MAVTAALPAPAAAAVAAAGGNATPAMPKPAEVAPNVALLWASALKKGPAGAGTDAVRRILY